MNLFSSADPGYSADKDAAGEVTQTSRKKEWTKCWVGTYSLTWIELMDPEPIIDTQLFLSSDQFTHSIEKKHWTPVFDFRQN